MENKPDQKQPIARKNFLLSAGMVGGAFLFASRNTAQAGVDDVDLTSNQTITGNNTFVTGATFAMPGSPWVDAWAWGAVGNGASNPLSNYYNTLGAAQAVYNLVPNLVLSDEIDYAAIQQAILVAGAMTPNSAGTVRLGVGTFVINKPLSYITAATQKSGLRIIGEGMYNTIIDSRVSGGPAIQLDGGTNGSNRAQKAGILAGFSIITTISPPGNDGIYLRNQWYPKLEQVRVCGLTGNGITVQNDLGSVDATLFSLFNQLCVEGNGGWGMAVGSPSTANVTSGGLITNSYFGSNTSGGLSLPGLFWILEHSHVYMNGGYGLSLPANNSGNQHHSVRRCEFNSNGTAANIFILEGLRFELNDIRSIHRSGSAPVAIQIGQNNYSSPCQDIHVKHLRVNNAGAAEVTAVLNCNTCYYTRIEDLSVDSPYVLYNDEGAYTSVRQAGQDVMRADKVVVTNITTAGSTYTPNLYPSGVNEAQNGGIIHKVVVQASGTITIASPVVSGVGGGRRLIVEIVNNSGGAINASFGAAIRQAGYTNPAMSHSTSATFFYDANVGLWYQVSLWSPALAI